MEGNATCNKLRLDYVCWYLVRTQSQQDYGIWHGYLMGSEWEIEGDAEEES